MSIFFPGQKVLWVGGGGQGQGLKQWFGHFFFSLIFSVSQYWKHTRGPNQIPRFPCFILFKNPENCGKCGSFVLLLLQCATGSLKNYIFSVSQYWKHTRGPNQIPRFPCFILFKNPENCGKCGSFVLLLQCATRAVLKKIYFPSHSTGSTHVGQTKSPDFHTLSCSKTQKIAVNAGLLY